MLLDYKHLDSDVEKTSFVSNRGRGGRGVKGKDGKVLTVLSGNVDWVVAVFGVNLVNNARGRLSKCLKKGNKG